MSRSLSDTLSWDRLVTAIKDHLGLVLTETGTEQFRHTFSGVGAKNQDDFASAVLLETLTIRAQNGVVSETDVIRAGWRVAKQIYRQTREALAVDPSILNAISRAKPGTSGSASIGSPEVNDLLAFATRLDAIGAVILTMRLEGFALKEIAAQLGLSTTTVWDRLQGMATELGTQLNVNDEVSTRGPLTTAQLLLEGSVHSLAEAGLRIRSAYFLWERGDYAGAVIFATYAWEGIGQSLILRDLWHRVLNGHEVSPDEVRAACRDHVQKLRRGQLSTVQRGDTAQDGFSKLLGTMRTSRPGSGEWKDAKRVLDEAAERQRKRTPADRHRLRMRAQYVDLRPSGTGWDLPNDIPREIARRFLEDAANDYRMEYDRIQSRVATEPELLHALEAWSACPELPTPP